VIWQQLTVDADVTATVEDATTADAVEI